MALALTTLNHQPVYRFLAEQLRLISEPSTLVVAFFAVLGMAMLGRVGRRSSSSK